MLYATAVLAPAQATEPAQDENLLTRDELADFVLGKGAPARSAEALAELDRVLDRGRILPPGTAVPAVMDAQGKRKYNSGLEH